MNYATRPLRGERDGRQAEEALRTAERAGSTSLHGYWAAAPGGAAAATAATKIAAAGNASSRLLIRSLLARVRLVTLWLIIPVSLPGCGGRA
jgi:hypothetical protein